MDGLEHLRQSTQRLARWKDHHGIDARWVPYGGGMRLHAQKGKAKASVCISWANLFTYQTPDKAFARTEREVIEQLVENGADIPMPQRDNT